VEPLIDKLNQISVQGKEISIGINEVTANLTTATRYLAESTELIKEEVQDLAGDRKLHRDNRSRQRWRWSARP
jgi:hypothetical protein